MSKIRRRLFLSASALAFAPYALAQTAPASTGDTSGPEEVVVTGSRLTSRNFVQPTPTSVVTTEDIEKTAQPNIFTAIVQLPSLQGSSGRSVNTFS
ncbi:MAG TPA: hypothetical protein VFS47_11490, partial [Steroidobacteraceae bacterium]|nr:hypothetical protein [Steroidobacteraceae bacterium]